MNLWVGGARFLFLLAVAIVAGCATDPLTKTLRDNRYAPIVPITEGMSVGDVYRSTDITSQPVVLMNVLDPQWSASIMQKMKKAVTLPSVDYSRTNSLSANADILNYAKLDLQHAGATHFQVSIKEAHQYILPETDMEREIAPRIMKAAGAGEFYVVWGLLEASDIEYTFFKKNGEKVEVTPGSELVKVLKAKLGASWEASSTQNLVAKQSRFIGYRVAKLGIRQIPDVASTNASTTRISVTEIPESVLRNQQLQRLKQETVSPVGQSGNIAVITQNQSGGIAAGVHIGTQSNIGTQLNFYNYGPLNLQPEAQPPKFEILKIEEYQTPKDGNFFSRVLVRITSDQPLGKVGIGAESPAVESVNLQPQRAGMFVIGMPWKESGITWSYVQDFKGDVMVEVTCTKPEKFDLRYHFEK